MLEIRRPTDDDRPAVSKVWEEGGLSAANAQEWQAISKDGPARLLLAEDDGVLVGAVIASFDGWRAFISHLAVALGHRHQGVGSALLTEAEKELRQRGAMQVFVLVQQNNTDGLALCVENGYEPEGELALEKVLDRICS